MHVLVILLIVFLFVLLKTSASQFESEGILTYSDFPPPTSEKFMVRTWKKSLGELNEEVLKPMHKAMEMNTDYNMYYFSDEDVLKFIGDHFPEYLEPYKSLVPGAYKADLFRLLVLYKYGGVYNDIGHTLLEPIDKIKGNSTHVFVKDHTDLKYWIHNAFIISPANSPILKKMIDRSISMIKSKSYGEDPYDITGPTNSGKCLNMYWGLDQKTVIPEGDIGDIRIITHPTQGNIYGIDGNVVIEVKFPNFAKIIYDDAGETYYTDLYNKKEVYK